MKNSSCALALLQLSHVRCSLLPIYSYLHSLTAFLFSMLKSLLNQALDLHNLQMISWSSRYRAVRFRENQTFICDCDHPLGTTSALSPINGGQIQRYSNPNPTSVADIQKITIIHWSSSNALLIHQFSNNPLLIQILMDNQDSLFPTQIGKENFQYHAEQCYAYR